MTKTYFTITGGRTGTAWLARFFQKNLIHTALHEPLKIEDFGVNMPDIRIMRSFNEYGNTHEVQRFWARKFDNIRGSDLYCETNHTLAKCGLIENLANSDLAQNATVIILNRDIVDQCVSYISRRDFGNITLIWQWYLHSGYARNLLDATPFLKMGRVGMPLWYCHEMRARQAYYRLRYGDKIRFVTANMEDIVTKEGAPAFWKSVSGSSLCTVPPPQNQSKRKPAPKIVDQVREVASKVVFDPEAFAARAIKKNVSFDA